MTALACLAIAGLCVAAYAYAIPTRLSPDGPIYLSAGSGRSVPIPFHLRFGLPGMCGDSMPAWRFASLAGLVVAALFVGALAHVQGLDQLRVLFAVTLFCGLPIFRTTHELPVLVDGPALAFTAASACLAAMGYGWEAAVIALIGATLKETVPVFAALAVLSPWPLVGLVVPLARWALSTAARAEHPSQVRPFSYAREKAGAIRLSPFHTILPWGACLAVLWAPTPPVLLSLAASYALLLTASDSARIYQWAAIPVCVGAASVVPDGWLLPVAVAHLFHPWRGVI